MEATRVILGEAARLREQPVEEEELIAAKKHLRGLLLIQEESSEFADRNGESLLLKGKVKTLEKELAEIECVNREDIQQVANDIFVDEELTSAFVAERDLSDELTSVLRVE